MRHLLLALPLLLGQLPASQAQVSMGIGIEMPGISIGINLPIYPDLQRVPGYPVYYAPQAPGNYFYYDGLYWVFQGDEWYASSWYNGPWRRVLPDYVPVYVLRVPVRYYRLPPVYFNAWRPDAPPHWDEHWGRDWQQRRPDWNRWDRRAAPPPAPLPTYQRRYPQSRYPQEPERQRAIRAEHFDYQPREPVARQAYQLPDRSPPRPRPQAQPHPQLPVQARPPAQQQPREQPHLQQPPRQQPQQLQPPRQPQPKPQQPPPPRQPQNQQHQPPSAQPPAPPRDRPQAAPPPPHQQAAPQDRGQPADRGQRQNPPDAPNRGQDKKGDAPAQQGNDKKGGRGGD